MSGILAAIAARNGARSLARALREAVAVWTWRSVLSRTRPMPGKVLDRRCHLRRPGPLRKLEREARDRARARREGAGGQIHETRWTSACSRRARWGLRRRMPGAARNIRARRIRRSHYGGPTPFSEWSPPNGLYGSAPGYATIAASASPRRYRSQRDPGSPPLPSRCGGDVRSFVRPRLPSAVRGGCSPAPRVAVHPRGEAGGSSRTARS